MCWDMVEGETGIRVAVGGFLEGLMPGRQGALGKGHSPA